MTEKTTIKDLEERIRILEDQIEPFKDLRPYEMKILKWSARIVTGFAGIVALTISMSSLKEFWDKFLGGPP